MKIKASNSNARIQETYSDIKIIDVKTSSSSTNWNEEYVDILLQTKQKPQTLTIEHKKLSDPADIEFSEYLTFDLNNSLPAGRIIRIHSGVTPSNASTSDEFDKIYHDTNPTSWYFDSAGEIIRILNENGEILHSRTVVPDMWTNLDFIIIWNHDQTKAFVFFSSQTTVISDLLSLNYDRLKVEFEYKRNTGNADDVKLLRMGNDENEETYVECNLVSRYSTVTSPIAQKTKSVESVSLANS